MRQALAELLGSSRVRWRHRWRITRAAGRASVPLLATSGGKRAGRADLLHAVFS